MEFETVVISAKPSFPFFVEAVTRAVVDDQKEFPTTRRTRCLRKSKNVTALKILANW
jgi:hypothetical protein